MESAYKSHSFVSPERNNHPSMDVNMVNDESNTLIPPLAPKKKAAFDSNIYYKRASSMSAKNIELSQIKHKSPNNIPSTPKIHRYNNRIVENTFSPMKSHSSGSSRSSLKRNHQFSFIRYGDRLIPNIKQYASNNLEIANRDVTINKNTSLSGSFLYSGLNNIESDNHHTLTLAQLVASGGSETPSTYNRQRIEPSKKKLRTAKDDLDRNVSRRVYTEKINESLGFEADTPKNSLIAQILPSSNKVTENEASSDNLVIDYVKMNRDATWVTQSIIDSQLSSNVLNYSTVIPKRSYSSISSKAESSKLESNAPAKRLFEENILDDVESLKLYKQNQLDKFLSMTPSSSIKHNVNNNNNDDDNSKYNITHITPTTSNNGLLTPNTKKINLNILQNSLKANINLTNNNLDTPNSQKNDNISMDGSPLLLKNKKYQFPEISLNVHNKENIYEDDTTTSLNVKLHLSDSESEGNTINNISSKQKYDEESFNSDYSYESYTPTRRKLNFNSYLSDEYGNITDVVKDDDEYSMDKYTEKNSTIIEENENIFDITQEQNTSDLKNLKRLIANNMKKKEDIISDFDYNNFITNIFPKSVSNIVTGGYTEYLRNHIDMVDEKLMKNYLLTTHNNIHSNPTFNNISKNDIILNTHNIKVSLITEDSNNFNYDFIEILRENNSTNHKLTLKYILEIFGSMHIDCKSYNNSIFNKLPIQYSWTKYCSYTNNNSTIFYKAHPIFGANNNNSCSVYHSRKSNQELSLVNHKEMIPLSKRAVVACRFYLNHSGYSKNICDPRYSIATFFNDPTKVSKMLSNTHLARHTENKRRLLISRFRKGLILKKYEDLRKNISFKQNQNSNQLELYNDDIVGNVFDQQPNYLVISSDKKNALSRIRNDTRLSTVILQLCMKFKINVNSALEIVQRGAARTLLSSSSTNYNSLVNNCTLFKGISSFENQLINTISGLGSGAMSALRVINSKDKIGQTRIRDGKLDESCEVIYDVDADIIDRGQQGGIHPLVMNIEPSINNNLNDIKHSIRPSLPDAPTKVLDGPGLRNDYYINVISWSKLGLVAVGLNRTCYIWDSQTQLVVKLFDTSDSIRRIGIPSGWENDDNIESLIVLSSYGEPICDLIQNKDFDTLLYKNNLVEIIWKNSYSDYITSCSFSNNGNYLCITTNAGRCVLYRCITGNDINSFAGYGEYVEKINITNKSQDIASYVKDVASAFVKNNNIKVSNKDVHTPNNASTDSSNNTSMDAAKDGVLHHILSSYKTSDVQDFPFSFTKVFSTISECAITSSSWTQSPLKLNSYVNYINNDELYMNTNSNVSNSIKMFDDSIFYDQNSKAYGSWDILALGMVTGDIYCYQMNDKAYADSLSCMFSTHATYSMDDLPTFVELIRIFTSFNYVDYRSVDDFDSNDEELPYDLSDDEVNTIIYDSKTSSQNSDEDKKLTNIYNGGHKERIVGLSWSPDGLTLASGGNDNLVCLWDLIPSIVLKAKRTVQNSSAPRDKVYLTRQSFSNVDVRFRNGDGYDMEILETSPSLFGCRIMNKSALLYSPRVIIREHQSAVRALSWSSPNVGNSIKFECNNRNIFDKSTNSLLATGGGLADQKIRIFDSHGNKLAEQKTSAQVCCLQWGPSTKYSNTKNNSNKYEFEIISTLFDFTSTNTVVWELSTDKRSTKIGNNFNKTNTNRNLINNDKIKDWLYICATDEDIEIDDGEYLYHYDSSDTSYALILVNNPYLDLDVDYFFNTLEKVRNEVNEASNKKTTFSNRKNSKTVESYNLDDEITLASSSSEINHETNKLDANSTITVDIPTSQPLLVKSISHNEFLGGLELVGKIPKESNHTKRPLFMSLSPCGEFVVTASPDECIKFWHIWPGAKETVYELSSCDTISPFLSTSHLSKKNLNLAKSCIKKSIYPDYYKSLFAKLLIKSNKTNVNSTLANKNLSKGMMLNISRNTLDIPQNKKIDEFYCISGKERPAKEIDSWMKMIEN